MADRDSVPPPSPAAPTTATNPPLREVLATRLSRRDFLVRTAAVAASVALRAPFGVPGAAAAAANGAGTGGASGTGSSLTFRELPRADRGVAQRIAEGYRADVLVRWGDPVLDGAAPWNPAAQSPVAQAHQFGYNNDFLAYMPLPRGSQNSEHGLLCVNHEYTSTELMFSDTRMATGQMNRERRAAIEMAAHGHSVLEVERVDGTWRTLPGGPYSRRLTATTPMSLRGPAAGHPRLRTAADPTGRTVLGTLNNCAGGVTPWGTVLIAEENFHKYFRGVAANQTHPESAARYGLGEAEYDWYADDARFDSQANPHEFNRFGWIVEYDPYDPTSVPVKRTALGRFRHEGATCTLAPDGRVVVYTGDDSTFEHLYRFVSRDAYDPEQPDPHLLDHGTLYAARCDADGTLVWLPLRHGQGPLTAERGFASQADVLIDARLAATALGATPMDRPEDFETNPTNGHVYVMLTNNKERKATGTDAANPRGPNADGHILELIPPGAPAADHAAERFRWELFLTAGPTGTAGAAYHPATTEAGRFTAPDNCAFDPRGRLWVATDMSSLQAKYGMADGIWATDTAGDARALTRHFYAAPAGAEICGPTFTPDGRTLFLSIQHPGEGGDYTSPLTRWPDFDPAVPPRPSVIAITHRGGEPIGV